MPGQKTNAPPRIKTDERAVALRKLRIVFRAAQRHSDWIEKQCGLTGSQLWIMRELNDAPGLRVGEVAQRLSIHQTTTSNIVDALLKKGFVVKLRDESDQRVVRLFLTSKGKGVLASAPSPARGMIAEALTRLDDRDLRSLNKGLTALVEAVERACESDGLKLFPFMI
jgi:DNA-binding MarR family transcriptional regulator